MARSLVLMVAALTLAFAAGVAAAQDVPVGGYVRKDGTYVQPYRRSRPDGNPYNNYSFPGNVNPNTGRVSPGNPDTYLRDHDSQGLGGGLGNRRMRGSNGD